MYNTIKQLIAIVCKLYFLTVILISELSKFFLPPPYNYKEMILIFQLKKYHCLHRSPCLQDPPYYCENLEPQFTVRRKLKFDSASFPFLLFKSGNHMKHKKTHEWLFLINHVFLKSIRCALYGYKSTAMKWEYSDWCGYLVVNAILNKLTRTKTTTRCISPIACI